MKNILSKYLAKLFFQQWIIGVARASIDEIIRNKTFDPAIKWLPVKSKAEFYADPFLYKTKEGEYAILFEEYSINGYGKISLMLLNEHQGLVRDRILLDTKSHLSYPFVYTENDTIYVFPEASQSGKLSCYQYDPVSKTLRFVKVIIELPVLDPTIIKKDNKYWLFCTLNREDPDNKLYVYYADDLLGPYTPHVKNPVKSGLEGSRPAGNFIVVDAEVYRPAQNSKYVYGGSLIIHKITRLDEVDVTEEFYMDITINSKNKLNSGIRGIHTINSLDDIIVVDGIRWRFSPATKRKQIAIKLKQRRSKASGIKPAYE